MTQVINNKNEIIATLPFTGNWIVGATPDHKIPSHGTFQFGVGYAYDFMAVGENNKVSPKISWRTLFSTENPEHFYSFGQSVNSPVNGIVIKTHNSEPDNIVRRSIFTGIPYLMGQRNRVKQGIEKIAGNYVIIKVENSNNYICIVHLKNNSVIVAEGQFIAQGQQIAECGNSGNSIQPHVHIQAMDKLDVDIKEIKGIPLFFDNYTEFNVRDKKKRNMKKSFPKKNHIISSN